MRIWNKEMKHDWRRAVTSNECFASRTEVNPTGPWNVVLTGNENKDVTLVITISNNHQKLMVVEDILLLIDRSQIEVTAGK